MNGKSSESTKAADQVNDVMDCRADCGPCCIAPLISSPIPGMPHGKPAGIPCEQLTGECASAIFGRPERPEVCRRLRPAPAMCGTDREAALATLMALESATRPL
jgi:hypothetical protein